MIACVFAVVASFQPCHAQAVELRNGFFYLDGEKTFLKGIGYEVGALPGQLPWTRPFRPDVIRADMQRIVRGGFNTIRTWDAFTEAELDVVAEFDIHIIMGIWIDPHADFSNPSFVNQARNRVAEVLDYSKDYDNIIAYLIMNEPLAATISNAGYGATVSLWEQLISLIHTEHPGRPVSISNSSNGTYIDPAIFDFNGHNGYIYSPVTVNYLHGYRDYVAYLKALGTAGQPLIMTEYGLSVSPGGPGGWGYGGNSLHEQTAGNLHMYKALVDGGASGSCMFNYSDGWWKGGDEFSHDNNPEEWFGLVEYQDLADAFGTERPVWEAVKQYQSAIVTEPKTAGIYTGLMPIEVFADDTIAAMAITLDGDTLYDAEIQNAHFTDTLDLNVEEPTDMALQFHFFNSQGELVKSEEKSILFTSIAIELPSIDIYIVNQNFWDVGFIEVRYEVRMSDITEPGTDLDYIFYPHIGFTYGSAFSRPMAGDEDFSFTRLHTIGSNVNAITVGAAFDVVHGDFSKRIVNEKTVTRWDEVTTHTGEDQGQAALVLYPNPARETVRLLRSEILTGPVHYAWMDVSGKIVGCGTLFEGQGGLDVSTLAPGIYFLQLRAADGTVYSSRLLKR
jgi:hypothetical protein